MIGQTLGPYEIVARLGAGGMGEVYKARDTRLDRVVAIKLLPPEWADAPEMQQRFDREAQVIASLNHPNICKLHDVGTGSVPAHEVGLTPLTVTFLVMEFLDGETLADRLTRGPVPLDQALEIGIAIANALDKAHRQGVMHRDLKPANIMLTATGPKLLDFGLAKPASALVRETGTSQAPTRTTPAKPITMAGAILGTLQYMAPEQLDGVEADARTDIFALGVVLHEMVTGRRAFEGKSQVLLISAIATAHPPPLSRVQPTVPPALDHVVRTCLAKDPEDRWQTARDLQAELRWIAGGGGVAADAAAAASLGRRTQTPWLRGLLAGAALLVVALAVPAALYVRGVPAPEKSEVRVSTMPLAYATNPGQNGFFAVSPDGRTLAVRAREPGNASEDNALYVGTIDFLAPRRLTGTDDATQPFWSADGRSIGFISNGKLQKIEAAGGPPSPICPVSVSAFRGGTWNRDGTILFGAAEGLFSVPAEGGKPTPVTTVAPGEAGHFWPVFLPDGRHFLYLAWSDQPAGRAIFAGSLDSKDRTEVMRSESNAEFTQPGFLVFRRDGSLYGQPFDPGTLALSGSPARLADAIPVSPSGRISFSLSSDEGVLAFYRNPSYLSAVATSSNLSQREFQLAWVDRSGQDPQTVGTPGVYRGTEVSLDGKRVAVHRHDQNGGDAWVFEPTGTQTRITFDPATDNSNPVWSPDAARIAYSSLRKGKWGIYQSASDGSGREELLVESEVLKAPMGWAPDGQRLLYWVQDPKTLGDLWVWSAADKKAEAFLATSADERHGQISADGKWIAYSSTLTGRREIFVQPFPSGGGRWQVSPDFMDGGGWPRWSQKTNELFYHGSPGGGSAGVTTLFAVPWKATAGTFKHDPPKPVVRVYSVNYEHPGGDYQSFAVSPDGQRFLISQILAAETVASTPSGPDPVAGLSVLMHWTGTLKK